MFKNFFMVGAALFSLSACVYANQLFPVDFQQNGDTVQSGFNQFAGAASSTGTTVESFGNYTVSVTPQVDSLDLGGGYFDRDQAGGSFSPVVNSGAFTYANLYNSFAYNNSSASFASSAPTSITVVLSGVGIAPSTSYALTFYSFDSDAGRAFSSGTHGFSVGGVSGTTGSTSTLFWSDTSQPTSNNQDSISGIFTSDATGHLTFLVGDTYTGNLDSRSGVRLNALVLSDAAPEPGTLLSGGIGLALLLFASIRRRSHKA
jgi:hypothetical protein